MRIVILANPRSGRGRALRLGDRLADILRGRGHAVDRPELRRDLDIAGAAAGADRLVIVGGDGTVHHAAGAAARAGVPVYHLATGTENLIARSFMMPREPAAAAERLEADHAPMEIDLGSANGVPFVLMCSLGIDASTLHRVEAMRGDRGGHLRYVWPSLAEALRPRPAHLHLTGDGEPIGPPEGFRGTVVVSNLPAYALRIDPASGADPTDGRLDMAMLPATTGPGTAWDLLRCRLRSRGIRRIRASRFEIRTANPAADNILQIDGERPEADMHGDALPPTLRGWDGVLALEVGPLKLRVHARSWC